MTLTPIKKRAQQSPIFKSFDPEFNHRAAQAAYELVMKMDEDEARMFTGIVVADVTEEIIEKNLRTVQRHLDEVLARRAERVKKAVLRKAAEDPEGAKPYLEALEEIAKAAQPNPYDYGYRFQETDFNRDPSTGRFRTKVTRTQTKPINDTTAQALGIKPPPANLPKNRKAQYQDEYRQLSQFLGAVHESAQNPGEVKVALTYEDKSGQRYTEVINGTKVPKEKLGQEERLIGIQASPGALTAGGAAFGLTQALGRKGTESMNNAEANVGSFASEWTRPGDTLNSNDRTYRRIAAGSQYLGQIAPYSEKAQMAAAFGSFVGNMGPEAERVMGPTARKTAYRYRGTEKTPDKRLVNAYAQAINQAKGQSANDPYRNTPEGKRANLKSPSTLAPHQMARARQSAADRAPNWDERELGRRTIVAYFKGDKERGVKGKIPSQQLYGLQLASGNTPPSEGIMLNKDGQIVTQAVGYGDDHYLPFDLKNLKQLKGGEYIRTRSVGGLTSEDIYTGLMSGARQVTVVSRSGTFTMTFDEDFKGGRRYNDKARRMTRRYEQILDAVQSEKVDRGQVRPEIQEIIENDVRTRMEGYASAREIRATIKQRVEEYKENPDLAPEDEQLINAMSRAAMRDGVTRDEKEYKRQITGKILAEKQTRYRLDGHGYDAALKALEEQFPYYITVKSKPEDAQDIQNLELDRGYVEPGRNRPTAAAAGLFGAAHGIDRQFQGQGGKVSASQVDYQTGRRSGPPPATEEEKTAAEAKEKVATGSKDKVISSEQMASYLPAITEMQELLRSQYGPESFKNAAHRRLLDVTPDEIANDPIKQRQFDDMVSTVQRDLKNSNRDPEEELGDTLTRYQKAIGDFNRRSWDPSLSGITAGLPPVFEGKGYDGKDSGAREAEMQRIESELMPSSIASTKRLRDMNDAELKSEVSRLLRIKEKLSGAGIDPKDTDAVMASKEAVKHLAPNPDSPALRKMVDGGDPKVIDTYLEAVQRMRALKHVAAAGEGQPETRYSSPQQAQRSREDNLRVALGTPEYDLGILMFASREARKRPDQASQDRADGYEYAARELAAVKDRPQYDALRDDDATGYHMMIQQADRTYRGDFLKFAQERGLGQRKDPSRGGGSILS